MSKLVRLQRREQSSDGVNWYPLDTYRVAYVIEEESNCQDDDIVYTKWVNTSEFECENGTKHFLAKKQLSYDNQSWFDANPIEYRRNGITVSGAWECQGIEPTAPYSRLVETDLWECGDNYTKHYLSERQFSYDNIEWFSYIPKKYEWDATRTEYYSKDCGYMPPKEQSVHLYFTDGTEDWVFHPSSYIEPHYYDGINGIYGRNDIEKVEIGQMLIRIDDYAFANQPNLKEAYFEDYVIDGANNIFFGDQMLCKVNDNPRGTLRLSTEVLGNGAFNYTAFDTIILDEGNKSIGVSTFASMGNLTSVTLPSTVETISGSAFYNCFSLDNIDIAATTPPQIEFDTFLMVKEYGKLNTPNGSNYSQWLSFDEFYLGYYHWNNTEPPTPIGDYDVKLTFQDGTTRVDTYPSGRIPSSAYTSGTTIVKVEIGDRITEIGNAAFNYCSNLTSVDSPNCTTVGDLAFQSCTSLTSVNIPNFTTVGGAAFNNCTSLTSIDLPNCTTVGDGAFMYCTGLTSIDLSSCTTVGVMAFDRCWSLTSANLPNCTSVDDRVFQNCSGLTSANLPNCTSVGEAAFYDCYSLASIDLPNCTSVGNDAFRVCTSLTSVNIPNCTTVGGGAFDSCSGLTSVTIPTSVTTIGNEAFQYCASLSSVTYNDVTYEYRQDLEEALTANGVTLGTDVFEKTALKERFGGYDVRLTFQDGTTQVDTYSDGVIPRSAYESGSTIVKVEIGDGITKIGDSAFADCTNLTSIDSPSCTSVDFNAFVACSSLTSVDLPRCTSIGGLAFAACSSLTSIDLPNCTSVGFGAFQVCDSLASIDLPNCATVDSNAFYSCSSLTTVNLPNCTSVGDNAFYFCTSLTSIDLPSCTTVGGAFALCLGLTSIDLPSCTTVGGSAFAGCFSLTNITIPTSVTSVGNEAFYDCRKLTSVTYNGEIYEYRQDLEEALTANGVTLGTDVFKDTALKEREDPPTPKMIVTLANGNVEIYEYANGIIAENALCGRTDVVSVELDGIVEIGKKAFYNCKNLTSMTINEGVEVIGNDSLHNVGLTSLTLPSTLRVVDLWAFSESVAITKSSAITLNMTSEEAINNIYLGEGAFWTRQNIAILTTDDLVIFDYYTCKNTNKFIANPNPPTPLGDYDVKLTFQDGTTRTDTYNDGKIPLSAYTSGTTIVKVEIGDRITTIDDYAFQNCSRLKSIDSPNCITVGYQAFGYCTRLTSIDLPNCTTVGSWAFFRCTSLTSVNIPNCTSVGNDAFQDCTSLTSVNIPNCTRVRNWAFSNCTSLPSIDLPNCTSVGEGAFFACESLTSVTIPTSVTTIGNNAFESCSSLSSVTYNGVTYEYREDIEEALTANGVTLGDDVFKDTALKER